MFIKSNNDYRTERETMNRTKIIRKKKILNLAMSANLKIYVRLASNSKFKETTYRR